MAEANWYWAEGDKQNGPVTPSAIARLVADGKLGEEDLIWKEGTPDWIPIGKVPSLVKYIKKPTIAATPSGGVLRQQAPAAVIPYQTAPVDHRSVHQYVTDPNAAVTCPHCSAGNTTDSHYCEACGMALPIPNNGPRIVDDASLASTTVGQQFQSDELHKQAKSAATALMIVAIIQTIFGGIWIASTAANPRMAPITEQPIAITLAVTAVIFWGLYVWARQQPLPAAIVGLVLYVTLKTLDLIAIISQASNGNQANSNNPFGGTGIGYMTIVIIIVLARAISAGLKYRKLQAAAASTGT